MKRNLATSLKRRQREAPMARFDRLPRELRQWLAGAALPWSAASALAIWQKAGGDPAAACARLTRAEARMLARDAPKIWGQGYPL